MAHNRFTKVRSFWAFTVGMLGVIKQKFIGYDYWHYNENKI